MTSRSLSKLAAAVLPSPLERSVRRRVRQLRAEWRLLGALVSDWRRFRRQSGLLHDSRLVVEARMIKAYHRIEKGLALAEPRPGFGADAVSGLRTDLADYITHFGADRTTRAALNCLREYERFNAASGMDTHDLAKQLDALELRHGPSVTHDEGGTVEVSRDAIHATSLRDLSAFFASRYSVRQFSDRPVDTALIEAAVRMAQKAPSVCNREAGRLFIAEGKALKALALSHQNGNRGFGEQADKVLIVGASLSCFHTVGERYQAWIDGGMYAMSLVYALHSLGLGSCCLNWSVEPATDRALREAIALPQDVQVIMMLAVGHLPERFRVAQSPRRPLPSVMQILDSKTGAQI